MGHCVVDGNGFLKVVIGHDVQNGRKGFLQHGAGLRLHLNQGRAHIKRGRLAGLHALAKVHRRTAGFGRGQCTLHGLKSALVNQRPHQRAGGQWIANREFFKHTHQRRHQIGIDRTVHDQASQAGAALAGSAGGSKRCTQHHQIQVGRGAHNGRVVATELQQRTLEVRRTGHPYRLAHGGGTRGADQLDLRVRHQGFTHRTVTHQHRQQARAINA